MSNEDYFTPRKINTSQIKNLMKGARNYLTHRESEFWSPYCPNQNGEKISVSAKNNG